MENSTFRTDSPSEISYPANADTRGYTRINFQKKPYYMGRFDTAHSYVMFGLWKHQLERDGVPPETKDLKPTVEEFLALEPQQIAPARRAQTRLMYLAAAALCLLACGISFQIGSSLTSQKVDGVALSELETTVLRSLRAQEAKRAAIQLERVDRTTELFWQLKESMDAKENHLATGH